MASQLQPSDKPKSKPQRYFCIYPVTRFGVFCDGREFKSLSDLRDHYLTNHVGCGFKCPVVGCGSLKPTLEYLRSHWENVHRDEYCLVCGCHADPTTIRKHIFQEHGIPMESTPHDLIPNYTILFFGWHDFYWNQSDYDFFYPTTNPPPLPPKIFTFQPTYETDEFLTVDQLSSFQVLIRVSDGGLMLKHDVLKRPRPSIEELVV